MVQLGEGEGEGEGATAASVSVAPERIAGELSTLTGAIRSLPRGPGTKVLVSIFPSSVSNDLGGDCSYIIGGT
jgi:hypothetical protein